MSPTPYLSQSPQRFSPLNPLDLDEDEFDSLFSQPSEGPSQPVEEDSPVDEEDVALCRAWVDVPKNSKEGNAKKSTGYNGAKSRHHGGACENSIYQVSEKEYREISRTLFPIVECWKIVKDHQKWKYVEIPKFLKSKNPSSKKSRTSKTTSHGTLDSTHIALELNDKATDSEDVEVQEVRPVVDHSLIDAFVRKFKNVATPLFSSRSESSSEYLRIKERELEMEDLRHREQAELERLNLAQAKIFEEQRLV
ncbi:glutathione S-transferase T3-like protein [Tanacetum coccineum]